MLKLTAIGNIGRDAEIREVGSARVINFAVAHSEKYRDKTSGLMVDRTVWVNCSYWRDPDKTGVAQYLTKGKKVYVEGIPSTRHYKGRDGEDNASLELRVLSLELLSSQGEQTDNAAQPSQQPKAAPAAQPQKDLEDDLPF